MSTKTKQKIEHTREFWCELCDRECKAPPMTATEALAHLHTVHHITSTKGQKTPFSFLDGDTYTNTYVWSFAAEVGRVKMIEVASGPKQFA